jgi:hypothetical protein
MTISEKLEQRLKNLEIEQEKQDVALNDLGDFEEDIRKLEAALAQIDKYQVSRSEDTFEREELEETRKIERELQRMAELEHVDKGKATTDEKTSKQPKKTAQRPSTNSGPQGYVICVMLNSKSPREWSGTGWCEPSKGMRYTNPEQVKQTFQRLKKQWPNYPLKILKR